VVLATTGDPADLNHVADKLGLREHIQFNSRIEAMVFDEAGDSWTLRLEDGRELTTRFVLTAIGVLSVPTMPRIDGMESFEGQSFHSFHWPKEPVELAGKRVAVLGTGATAIQIIPEAAKEAGPSRSGSAM
jgi:cation diffusion facilitator CzcD-associated flavoprotein CzcO